MRAGIPTAVLFVVTSVIQTALAAIVVLSPIFIFSKIFEPVKSVSLFPIFAFLLSSLDLLPIVTPWYIVQLSPIIELLPITVRFYL